MDIDYVKQQVSKLNRDWYKSKKRFFQKENGYDTERGHVYKILPDKESLYDEEGVYITDKDIVIDVNINQYCWNDYFETSFSDKGYYDEELPINSKVIAYQIIQWIENTIKGVDDIAAKHKVILSVIDTIKDQIEIFTKENSDSDEYIDILDQFLILCRQCISRRFSFTKKVHLITTEYSKNERLTFELNQEELGALLYILYMSDILKISTPGDTSFLNFCQDRFYFYNQKAKAYTKAILLRNKFNDSKKSSSKARKEVIKKLKAVINRLKKG